MEKSYQINEYVPNRQDVVYIDFLPSIGKEIGKRRPAVVLSTQGYSKLTGLVIVTPITHAEHSAMRYSEFFVPIFNSKVDGYVNPLQIHSFDIHERNVQYISTLNGLDFFRVNNILKKILRY
ncbi:type II toxin-antitoxin system PemK/MazF family toxin [Companilactobacillus ginsenosidimutans]|uniref:Cell division protein n=1 Tax=Companilactobacillus ginsenosidimutans TaxID=1007676 RepID=A0A0H4QJJ3_9LACO|nr:type II toxin-antitoxin system PemK/MazF family toxin [Companilactobacillus ginsenosidimutans]AKP67211.1 cell division protein [Companilactobacillus ginsenosidimutans]